MLGLRGVQGRSKCDERHFYRGDVIDAAACTYVQTGLHISAGTDDARGQF